MVEECNSRVCANTPRLLLTMRLKDHHLQSRCSSRLCRGTKDMIQDGKAENRSRT